MTSVTSPPALRRLCLFGMVGLLVALIMATGTFGIGSASAAPAVPDCDLESPAADCHWISAALAAEHSGEAPPCRLLALRPSLTFGDSAWDEVTADQGTAAIATVRDRQRAITALQLAPLRASLQLQKIRLQV